MHALMTANSSLVGNVPILFLTAMKREIDKEIADYPDNVIAFNKLDKIDLIVDEIEKYLA